MFAANKAQRAVRDAKSSPQGLKAPTDFAGCYGTDKSVPFQDGWLSRRTAWIEPSFFKADGTTEFVPCYNAGIK